MALSSSLIFGLSPMFLSAMTKITVFLEQTGFYLLLLMVLFSFTSGIGSCRKDGKLHPVLISSVIWAIASTLLLSLSAVFVFHYFHAVFPVSASAGMESAPLASFPKESLVSLGLLPSSPLGFFEKTRALIPSFLVVCFLLGYCLKPNAEVIRPAYVVTNSFSEVMFRLTKAITLSSYLFVFVSASTFFSSLMQEGTVFVANGFVAMLVAASLVALLVVLPLFFMFVTGFKVNPYQMLYRSIATAAIGFFSSDILLTALVGQPIARHNLGCQKRIAATTIPIHAIIGRGGSAMVGTLCCLSLLSAASPVALNSQMEVLVALTCAMCSFASMFSLGSETILIVVLAFRFLGINMYGSEMTMISLLPLIGGVGTMIDALVAALGANWSATLLEVRVPTPYKDIL